MVFSVHDLCSGEEEDPRALRKYCQFCRCYMTESGDIESYFRLFDGYQLDSEDKKVLSSIFANRKLCAKCYRPYKKYSDGSSNRYQRWQVTIEMLSFYVFMLVMYVPLLVLITVPALFVGLWNRIQMLSDSTKHVAAKSTVGGDQPPPPRKSSDSLYRTQIRKIIEDELTSETEEMQQKLDKILRATVKPTARDKDKADFGGDTERTERDMDGRSELGRSELDPMDIRKGSVNEAHPVGISNDQYSHLVSMMNALSSQLESLRNTVHTDITTRSLPKSDADRRDRAQLASTPSTSRSSSARRLKRSKSNKKVPRSGGDGAASYTPSPRRTKSPTNTSRK